MLHPPAANAGTMRPEEAENQRTIQIWVCDVCKISKFDDFKEACRHEETCGKDHSKKKQELSTNMTQPSGDAAKSASKNKSIHAFFTCKQRKQDESIVTITNPKLAESILANSRRGNVPATKRKYPEAAIESNLIRANSDTKDKAKKPKTGVSQSDLLKKAGSTVVNHCESDKGGACTSSPSNFSLAAIFGTKNFREIEAEQRAVELIAKRRLTDLARQQNRKLAIAPKKESARHHPMGRNPDRFPVPSHVGASGTDHKDSSKYVHVLSILRKSHKHRGGGDKRSNDVAPYRHVRAPAIASAVDVAFAMLSTAFVAPKAIDLDDHELWSKKYTIKGIPYNVCGATNKTIARSCTRFVDEWKVERQKALSRRADKQDRLARGRKMPSKKKRLDDLWDDASDDNQAGLPSICLLTGPVGCGKTSLVYAVAKSCDCKVMEINTTDKRSSQNLRNAIEEATQSDSTIDMLKNRAAALSVLSSRKAALVDSEDEDSDEEGSSVPIVLVDEVDLIFENDGDSGFWPALKAMAKRAKCPIFLTANVIPQALSALSMRFKHYSMERPTPEECMSKIWQVVKSENLVHRQNLHHDQVKQTLVSFAERYECDLRRVLLEMQIFTKARTCVPVPEPVLLQLPGKVSIFSGIPFFENEHVVEKITPNVIPAQRQTRLKIEGRGFASLSLNYSVSIGDQVCDAETVDDNTISAICPPLQLQETRFLYAGRFPMVKIEASPSLRSAIGKMIKTIELNNGSTILAVSHLNVEYVPPHMSSDEAIETTSKVHSKKADDSPVHQLETEKSTEKPKMVDNEDLRTLEELTQLSYKLERRSDATWVEHSMYGIPWVGGASRGFASQFVEGFGTSSDPTTTSKLCRDSNSKPPPIERILLSGWNDHECFFGDSDVYFTNPGHRDRQLYSQIARFGHQGSLTTSIQSPEAEDADDIEPEDIQTKHFPCQPDEESFSMRETLLAELSSRLMSLLGYSPGNVQQTNSLHRKRRKRQLRTTNAFFSLLWHDVNTCLVFARGVGRDIDSEEPFDERIFLDYGPILSQICLYEAAALSLSDASADDTQSSSRRTTRRSKERMHPHHFMKVNQGLYEEDCREIGRNRATCLLRY